jgi:hypothetical protein
MQLPVDDRHAGYKQKLPKNINTATDLGKLFPARDK